MKRFARSGKINFDLNLPTNNDRNSGRILLIRENFDSPDDFAAAFCECSSLLRKRPSSLVTLYGGEHSQVCVTKGRDQLLFELAMDAAEHGKFCVADDSLRTLVETYPDSEYAAKARKLQEPQFVSYRLQKQGWIIDCAAEVQIPTITSVVPDSLDTPTNRASRK